MSARGNDLPAQRVEPGSAANPRGSIEAGLAGRNVLITGGTGSFGKTMVHRLLGTDVAEVRVLSRDEEKQDMMRRQVSDSRLRFYLGDVRDVGSVDRATSGADFVFHAAALKQVPSCEFFPMEAVRTNVVGSLNLVEAAAANGVASVVCLSTDKAVYPVNAMGLSKGLMEKVAAAYARNLPTMPTTVSTVRYGNVLYSRGSVCPLFVEAIKNGRRIHITDPRMTRFIMSLEEAVELVEYAFVHARQGDLFIRKAPACTIDTLARALCGLFDVPYHRLIIGIRHGEKLYETLVSREEMARAQDCGDYFRVPVDTRDLNYQLYFEDGDPKEALFEDYTSHNTTQLSVEEVEQALLRLPEICEELASVGPRTRTKAQITGAPA